MLKRTLFAILPILALVAVPVALRTSAPVAPVTRSGEKLVIITPHAEPVKAEFSQAFTRYYQNKYGVELEIEFRSVGGTSDIVRYIADRYEAEFRRYYQQNKFTPEWSDELAAAFVNYRMTPKSHNSGERQTREIFLKSDVGIGIDIFWGGGTFDHSRNGWKGYAVDGKVHRRHPEYFKPEIIPPSFGGEPMYDPEGRYYGVVLASFGICYNPDRIRELDKWIPPERWSDLGMPDFFNRIAVSDPTKSGSANKCYESILQQTMADTVKAAGDEKKGTAKGWADGMNLIKRIVANSRTITDSASKVPRDIAAGNAAAGMAIDTYGLSEQQWSELLFDGKPRIRYVPPKGGTAVSADPVQLLRGAPNRRAAEEFIDFLLSIEGQKLWNYRVGTPGGPEKYALRRPPIRKDMYTPEHIASFSDPDYNPYIAGAEFVYNPQWTSPYFNLLRILIRCIALDVQPELTAAWQAIIEAGGPDKVPEAMYEFNKLPFPYEKARKAAQAIRVSKDNTVLDVSKVCRKWSEEAMANYRKAAKLAKEKR